MNLSFFNTDENKNWYQIRGWLLPSAAEKLYQYALEVDTSGQIVEIGSFAGKSTVVITQALQQIASHPAMFCVDISFQSDFDANLKQFGVSQIVNKVEASSLAAADNWNRPISFLYIDGHHGKAHAYADFVVWETMLQAGGIVALDDTAGFFLGPSLQVQAAIRTGCYKLLDEVGGVSFLRKKRPLISVIGDFPLAEGSLTAQVVNISAFSGAMEPTLCLIPLPKHQKQESDIANRAKALERPRKQLKKLETVSGLDNNTTQTLLYLRGCIEMQGTQIDSAINIFTQLQNLSFSCSLIHYRIDVRHIATLRLAQAFDLKGVRELAKSTYQKLLDPDVISEIVDQARLYLSRPFQLSNMSKGLLLREYVLKSPLAKYRSYFQSLQNLDTTLHPTHKPQLQPEEVTVQESLAKLQGMTSLAERLYLYKYTEKEYSGIGEIVELGCWLGSSTSCLAMGLESNPNITTKDKRIHVYDMFTWMEGWNQLPVVLGTPIEGKYKSGDSFLDEYIKRIEPWSHLVRVYPGDLTKMSWNQQKDIEFLFVDIMKSWELVNSIVRMFFPNLVPNTSIMYHNDWAHAGTPQIHLLMYKFRDYFTPIYHAAPAIVFKCVDKIPKDILKTSYSFQYFSNQEVEQAFNYSFSISPAQMYPMIFGAKVMCWIRQSKLDIAQLELDLARRKYDAELSQPGSGFANQFARLEKLLIKAQNRKMLLSEKSNINEPG